MKFLLLGLFLLHAAIAAPLEDISAEKVEIQEATLLGSENGKIIPQVEEKSLKKAVNEDAEEVEKTDEQKEAEAAFFGMMNPMSNPMMMNPMMNPMMMGGMGSMGPMMGMPFGMDPMMMGGMGQMGPMMGMPFGGMNHMMDPMMMMGGMNPMMNPMMMNPMMMDPMMMGGYGMPMMQGMPGMTPNSFMQDPDKALASYNQYKNSDYPVDYTLDCSDHCACDQVCKNTIGPCSCRCPPKCPVTPKRKRN